jgi:hypothetical protein
MVKNEGWVGDVINCALWLHACVLVCSMCFWLALQAICVLPLHLVAIFDLVVFLVQFGDRKEGFPNTIKS